MAADDPLKRWAARGYRKNSETSLDPKIQEKLDKALGPKQPDAFKVTGKVDQYCAKHGLERTSPPMPTSGGKWEFQAKVKGSEKKPNKYTVGASQLGL